MEHDDGSRGWGENIRPIISRQGTSATNKYIKDPIPSRPHTVSANTTGTQAASASNFQSNDATPISGNLDGRLVAVQKEISAIKSGILIAQKQALVKAGKLLIEPSSSHVVPLPAATQPSVVRNAAHHRPIVLGLLAEASNEGKDADLLCLEATASDDNGAELKKRKHAKAVMETHDEDTVCSGDVGLETVVLRNGNGNDNVMVIDNPMYDANNVTAGPDDQACREP
jgi:hypothetical protein